MPTVIGHHNVKDTAHWLASPKREEFFGPLGVTNIRTFVNPQNPTQVAVLMDVADMDALAAAMETPERPLRWSTTASTVLAGDSRRGVGRRHVAYVRFSLSAPSSGIGCRRASPRPPAADGTHPTRFHWPAETKPRLPHGSAPSRAVRVSVSPLIDHS